MSVCHDVGLSAPNIPQSRYGDFAPAVFSALHGMGFVEVQGPSDGDLLIKVESICRGHTGIKIGTEVIQTTEAGVMRTKIKGSWQSFQFPGVE